jgi:hypothetical protein
MPPHGRRRRGFNPVGSRVNARTSVGFLLVRLPGNT